jgi:hypothetical protein
MFTRLPASFSFDTLVTSILTGQCETQDVFALLSQLSTLQVLQQHGQKLHQAADTSCCVAADSVSASLCPTEACSSMEDVRGSRSPLIAPLRSSSHHNVH